MSALIGKKNNQWQYIIKNYFWGFKALVRVES
jgi:hypothetical protein